MFRAIGLPVAGVQPFNHALPTQAITPRKRLLEAQIVKVSREHPTLGYKKVTALMLSKGYQVNKKQVQRVRREEGLQVPPPRPRERRQGLSTCLPQQVTHRNHVWCWDLGSCGHVALRAR